MLLLTSYVTPESGSGGCTSYLGYATGQSRLRNFKIVPPSCPQSIVFERLPSAFFCLSVAFSFLSLFHYSLASSVIFVQLPSCCAGKSPLLLTSLNRSSKVQSRYQSKLAKKPILTASITSAVRYIPHYSLFTQILILVTIDPIRQR